MSPWQSGVQGILVALTDSFEKRHPLYARFPEPSAAACDGPPWTAGFGRSEQHGEEIRRVGCAAMDTVSWLRGVARGFVVGKAKQSGDVRSRAVADDAIREGNISSALATQARPGTPDSLGGLDARRARAAGAIPACAMRLCVPLVWPPKISERGGPFHGENRAEACLAGIPEGLGSAMRAMVSLRTLRPWTASNFIDTIDVRSTVAPTAADMRTLRRSKMLDARVSPAALWQKQGLRSFPAWEGGTRVFESTPMGSRCLAASSTDSLKPREEQEQETAGRVPDGSEWDVVVIGGGHAGTEAAAAAARIGAKTLLLTHKVSDIGALSCNPSIGGVGKGHLVCEVDALGGLMGRIADEAGVQFKVLNASKGPAVRGPRAQMDRLRYKRAALRLVRAQERLTLACGSVHDLLLDPHGAVCGVRLGADARGGAWEVRARRVVITTGTFLRGVPPPPRTKWTRRVPHPVLIGRAASLTPY